MQRHFYILAKLIFKTVIGFLFIIEVLDEQNCPDNGPGIVVINHVHRLDMLIIMAWSKIDIRPLMAKDVISGHPFISYLLRKISWICNTILVDRQGEFAPSTVKEILSALKSGALIGIAPEGTRSYDGSLQELKSGSSYLAIKSDVLIYPIVTTCYHRTSRWKHRIVLAYGKPF